MLETRIATVADAALITAHREAMFLAMDRGTEPVRATIRRNHEPWVARMIAADKYVGWITSDGDRPVASAGMLILDWPPTVMDPDEVHRGYLLNVFVEPEYRRRGLARALVEQCLAEARRRRIGVVALHASDEARPLYESLSFTATSEMYRVEPPPIQSPA
jgi:ribosomal protein S18 acetylase RimI-like enzyme